MPKVSETSRRRVAAVDIGTVTTRLLVADLEGDSIEEVARSTDITQLGEGLSTTGALAPQAIERVARVIAGYVETMRELNVESYAAVATSASRDASNGEQFSTVLRDVGLKLSIIDGAREAELSFLGATVQLQGQGLLVVDCGGGSTELVVGDVAGEGVARESVIVSARSIDVGSRRMTDLFFTDDPPSRAQIEQARAWATAEMRGYFDRLEERPRVMLALAGTATSLAAIHLGLEVYDATRVHGYELSGSDVADLFEMLASMPLARRREVVGLHPERAGVIVAGTLILETVLALAGLDAMVVSEHDLLYGILLDTYLDLQ